MSTLPNRPVMTRSIIGPLILIAIGALWLMVSQGYVPVDNIWAVLRFWPVLLIALGLDAILRWRWPILANLVAVVEVGLVVLAIVFAQQLGLPTGYRGWMGWMPFTMMGAPGSGHVTTEARTVSDFDSIAFSAVGDVTIQPGERAAVSIEAEDNVLAELRTQVRGSTLYIEFVHHDGWARVRPTRPIRITATVTDLKYLDLSGAGNVTATGLQVDRLEAKLSGAGNLEFQDLSADDVTFRLTGAGNLQAAGQVGQQDVTVSGVGSYKGGDLRSDSTRVVLSGLGSATVWATDTLNATVSGLGSVDYYGQPQVTKTVSGLGNVSHKGDR
jgi:hypothetical protein